MAWVVLFAEDGNDETAAVYQTADSRADAIAACERLTRSVPGSYAEPMAWADAAALGLVS